MTENEDRITAALKSDVGKPNFEATFTEVVTVETEIKSMIDELDEWMKPTYYPTPAALLPGDSYVVRDPYGVVLIIAPFNYPVQVRTNTLRRSCRSCSECAPTRYRLIADPIGSLVLNHDPPSVDYASIDCLYLRW